MNVIILVLLKFCWINREILLIEKYAFIENSFALQKKEWYRFSKKEFYILNYFTIALKNSFIFRTFKPVLNCK